MFKLTMFKVCQYCNTVNSEVARFCRECGRTAFETKKGLAKEGERYTGVVPVRGRENLSGPAAPKTEPKPKVKAEPPKPKAEPPKPKAEPPKPKAEPEDKAKSVLKPKAETSTEKPPAKKSSAKRSSVQKAPVQKKPVQKKPAEQAPADADNTHEEYKKAKAFNAAVEAAMQKDDAEAMNFVGHCYETGYGTDADAARAMRWYGLSADMGNAEGLYNVGRLYAGGIGAERDEKKAAEYYRKAADAGHGPALYELGLCYRYGRGVKKNSIMALDLMFKAAEKGVPAAVKFVKDLKQ